ncbi:hypothetical protein MHLP_00130 [Candidatus Mycoplasma haematolamae str. Purdue]|uniref:Transmembrane protein n=1 Tax=Mycoplasma haematolamae (strain Purdue) TaxID=1212765 RepID=I7CEE7_MYCHA|nr:hypothetical protein [Candidatus Mycoplasma haematolamae]AFO51606.1 hypothetical protein MHLP_00130 [Candidatus Mycoplasma haematolamae str. Purdue]
MRPVFSFDTFRGYLQEDLTTFEYRFLKKVFSQSAFSFGAFGLLVCTLSWAVDKAGGSSGAVAAGAAIAAFVSGVCLMFYYMPKYHADPLNVTPTFVKRAYLVLIATYAIVFVALLKILSTVSVISSSQNGFGGNLILGGTLFGGTLCVYLIPVTVGFFMKKHSSAIKLFNFIKACSIAYMVLFFASFILMFFSSEQTHRLHNSLLLLVGGAITFVSPILSVYRMKMVVRHLDESDPVAIKKWELFFVFETLVQLMQMAMYLVRLCLWTFSKCCGR